MSCRDVLGFLLEYLAGELPATQEVVFERHLMECPSCVNYLNSYRQTVRLGQSVADASLPEALPEALVQAILLAASTETKP